MVSRWPNSLLSVLKSAGRRMRDLGQRVQQQPGRVVLLPEQVLVRDGHLEHRDLQPADEALRAERDLRVVEQLVEEPGHDVQRHRVHLAHARADAGTLQLVQDVGGAVTPRAGGQRRARAQRREAVELQLRERAEQFGALHERRAAHAHARSAAAAPAAAAGGGHQLLQGGEHVLGGGLVDLGLDAVLVLDLPFLGGVLARRAVADLRQDRVLHQQVVQRLVDRADAVGDVVVEQLQEHRAQLDGLDQVAAGALVGVADRVRAERARLRLQVGVADQHAHALVERVDLLLADAAQLGRHLVELERLLQVVVGHQRELERREVDVGEAAADLPRLVGALLELGQEARVELLLELRALGARQLLDLEVELLQLAVLRLGGEFGERFVRLREHAGDGGVQLRAGQVAALRQKCVEC